MEKATLKIYNLQGKIIQIETFQNTDSGSFDISALPKGIYLVKGIIDNKKMVTKFVCSNRILFFSFLVIK
ncbi:MAG: T9SS type A sorting domain-containing protein [Draconibacterium sp.]|nr:T9SS type A sorting domain-containing protein [Draconibacterium sp.]